MINLLEKRKNDLGCRNRMNTRPMGKFKLI